MSATDLSLLLFGLDWDFSEEFGVGGVSCVAQSMSCATWRNQE